jgi:uroporphyrinogen III methyltransferase/synthase
MKTLYTGLTAPDVSYIHTPLIEITPVDDDTALRHAADKIDSYDYVLYTSRYTATYLGTLMAKARKTVSIGSATTEALRQMGVEDIEQVERDNSFGVIDWFSRQPRGRVLIPRSNLALPIIPDGLKTLGFEVDCITAYINRMPQHPQKVNLDEIARIVFTSPSTIDNFIRLYGNVPTDKELVTRGPVTEQHLQTILKQQQL